MADEEWLKLHAPVQPQRQPTPGEHVWTLRKNGRQIDCELLFRGKSYGWECRFLHSGELAYAQRFLLREHAFIEAKNHRRRLVKQGYDGNDVIESRR